MTQPIVLYGGFAKGVNPVTGLTVTVNVYRVTRASGATTQIVTGGAATEVGDGAYLYAVAAADLQTYDYLAAFKTTGDVDAKTIWAVYPALANAYSTELARLDATISSRNAVAPLDSTATQAAAAAAISAAAVATGAEVAAVADALLDDEEVSSGVSVRQALAAAGSAGNPWLEAMDTTTYPAPLAGYYLQRLANGKVELVAVFDPATMELSYYYGDDYANADGRAQLFATTHDLSAAGTTVTWRVLRAGTVIEVDCEIVSASQYLLAPTAAELAEIGVGTWQYDLEMLLAGERSVTEIAGLVRIRKDVR